MQSINHIYMHAVLFENISSSEAVKGDNYDEFFLLAGSSLQPALEVSLLEVLLFSQNIAAFPSCTKQ